MKKESLAQVFSCEFRKISKTIFFIKRLQAAASVIWMFTEAFPIWLLFRYGTWISQTGQQDYNDENVAGMLIRVHYVNNSLYSTFNSVL